MLGILGLGNRSTLHYINRLNEEYNRLNGGYSTCPFILKNTDFNSINPFLPHQFERLIPVVEHEINELNKWGVSRIIIPNITLHETIDKIAFPKEIRDKMVHPIDLLKDKMVHLNAENILILGTRYTMESNYITNGLKLPILRLSDATMEEVDNIRKEVYENGAGAQHLNQLEDILAEYPNTCVVIACTELSLVNCRLNKRALTIDLVEEQIQRALR